MTAKTHEGDPAAALPWVILGFGAIVWYAVAYHTRFQLEDALITYRYSSNLLSGHGFLYNPGERVLGTTTPLLALFLALVSWPFGAGSIREVAAVVMPVFGLAAGLVAYNALVRRGISASAAAVVMLLLYTQTPFIRTGIGGIETPVVLLLMGLSLLAMERSAAAMGVTCGLLLLCRIDTILWVAMVLLAVGMRSPRKMLAAAAIAFAVFLPWLVFAEFYFGTVLPNTIAAKTVVRPGREGMICTGRYALRYALWLARGTGFTGSMWFFVPWLMILLLGARRLLLRSRNSSWPIVALPVAYALALYVFRAPKFEWYLLPLTYTSIILLGVGITEVARWAGCLLPVRSRVPIAALLVIAICAAFCVSGVPTMIRRMSPRMTKEDQVRTEVGKWLRSNTPEDASVAMEAIGYQGYYSRRRVVDLAGLVTPEIVRLKRRTALNGGVFDQVLRRFQPDYIVLRSFEVDNNDHFSGGSLFPTQENEKRFHEKYREIRRFHAPGSCPDDEMLNVTVYERTGR